MQEVNNQVFTLNQIGTLLYKVAIAIGFFVTVIYLMHISHFPAGLTPGDAIFLVFVAIAFGLVITCLALIGAHATIWFAQLLTYGGRRMGKAMPNVGNRHQRFNDELRTLHVPLEERRLYPLYVQDKWMALTSFVSFITCLFVYLKIPDTEMRSILCGAFLSGFMLLVVNGHYNESPDPQKRQQTKFIKLGLPILVLFLYASPLQVSNAVFQLLGIRAPNVNILIPESERDLIAAATHALERPVSSCQMDTNGKLLLDGVDVLWSGIGDRVLVSVKSNPALSNSVQPWFSQKEIILSLPKDTRIVRTTPNTPLCLVLWR